MARSKNQMKLLTVELIAEPEELFKQTLKMIKGLPYWGTLSFPIASDVEVRVDSVDGGCYRVRRRRDLFKTMDEAIVPSARQAAIKASEYAGLT